MKSVRLGLPVFLLALCGMTFAQPGAGSGATPAAPSTAQKSFALMKSLAGTWQGPVAMPGKAKPIEAKIWMRITSRGNALVHEMQQAGTPTDPTQYDHPVTIFYVNGGHLKLVHYCDAGNRPQMVAHPSPDGKKLVFDFVHLSGGNQYGHMYHVVFTFINANHHTEDWTYLEPGDKPMRAHMDLHRVRDTANLQ